VTDPFFVFTVAPFGPIVAVTPGVAVAVAVAVVVTVGAGTTAVSVAPGTICVAVAVASAPDMADSLASGAGLLELHAASANSGAATLNGRIRTFISRLLV
jgi:hypothetical protein